MQWETERTTGGGDDLEGEQLLAALKTQRGIALNCKKMTVRMDETVIQEYLQWQVEVCDLALERRFDEAQQKFNEPPHQNSDVSAALDGVTENARRVVSATNTAIKATLSHFND